MKVARVRIDAHDFQCEGARWMLEESVYLGVATGWELETAKPGVPRFVFVPV